MALRILSGGPQGLAVVVGLIFTTAHHSCMGRPARYETHISESLESVRTTGLQG